MIEPSGLSYGHRATAVGKGKMLAKTEVSRFGPEACQTLPREVDPSCPSCSVYQLEKLDFDTLETRDAVIAAARM
jgi:hypothetical protein